MHLVVIPQGIFSDDLSDPALSEFAAPLVADRLSLIEPEFERVTLISGWKHGETTTRCQNGNVHHSIRTGDGRFRSSLTYIQYAVRKILAVRNEDVIVLNFNPSLIGAIIAKVCRALGIEFVTYFLGMPEQFGGSRKIIMSYRSLLRTSTRCICSTPVFRDRLQEIADVTVTIVPHGVDPMFEPDPSVGRDENLVLYVGRFASEKRLPLLVDAFADVAADNPDARLILIGARTDKDRAEVRDQAAERGVADRVEVEDRIRRADVPVWMNRAKTFVLPSRDEAFGMVLVEAMACGTPAIGMASGSVPWVIDDDRLVCSTRDELASVIERVLTDDDFYEDVRAHMLARAKDFPYDEWGRNIHNAIVGVPDAGLD